MTPKGSRPIRTDRRTRIDAPPDQVWATLVRVDRYQAWWPWLRSFDARALVAGDRWACTVQPPLPYRVRFTIELESIDTCTCVTALVGGDIEGPARIELAPEGAGTVLVLTAELKAARRWLRTLERWAHPVARFGHDQIIDRALADLASRVPEGVADD